jgi:kinesin family protein 6/9
MTGAGKTYTMTGSSSVFKYRGIVPRAINQIFALTSLKFDQAITVRVSYAEIYNEQIRDLLKNEDGSSGTNLQISDDQKGGCVVRGLS